ncbi:hypothetical protein [Novosphingobium mangrovi (ex Hu et al. 2023)]|uniref:Uncharacterized protein n=1 Tax=Novosphingobium mangrovi (ex Hu et al. 2023) TaxID=2930094 RepID=A0ABT0AC51_9SPHN|nr:hypothetical protein [Novosphingobium mangrovi (ex Hu et al. 2023)]MCJ1960781.1 hypothetical protein [Novosphingobium mangrovi (ex Hu et al. 2023)]
MSVSYKFATEQADAAARAADEAVLGNVRERALRSETAWRTMASQALKTEESRRRREEAAASARDEA